MIVPVYWFLCHLGLGDAIILSGAVTHFAETGNVNFPCWRKYLRSVRSFFILYPQVTVYPVDSEGEMMTHNGIQSGYYHSPPLLGESLDEWFYRQLGLPLEYRWTKCPVAEAAKCCPQEPVPEQPYAFVHDSPERPLIKLSTSLNIVRPTTLDGVLQYRDIIENASEIHVMNSSFWELTKHLNPQGKLFYHAYARPSSNPILDTPKSLHPWHIIA